MTPYDNTNSGILKTNDKGDNEKRPDFKGSINAGGVEYWISGWKQIGKEGSKLEGQRYLSLKLEPKDPPAAEAPQKPRLKDTLPPAPAMDDDDPF